MVLQCMDMTDKVYCMRSEPDSLPFSSQPEGPIQSIIILLVCIAI